MIHPNEEYHRLFRAALCQFGIEHIYVVPVVADPMIAMSPEAISKYVEGKVSSTFEALNIKYKDKPEELEAHLFYEAHLEIYETYAKPVMMYGYYLSELYFSAPWCAAKRNRDPRAQQTSALYQAWTWLTSMLNFEPTLLNMWLLVAFVRVTIMMFTVGFPNQFWKILRVDDKTHRDDKISPDCAWSEYVNRMSEKLQKKFSTLSKDQLEGKMGAIFNLMFNEFRRPCPCQRKIKDQADRCSGTLCIYFPCNAHPRLSHETG